MGLSALIPFLLGQREQYGSNPAPAPEVMPAIPAPQPTSYRRSGLRGLLAGARDFIAHPGLADPLGAAGEADAAALLGDQFLGENTPVYGDPMGPPPPTAPSLAPAGVAPAGPDAPMTQPASATTLASKLGGGEMTSAAAPVAPVMPPPAPIPPAGRPTGKNGEPLYTNEDLMKMHQGGPSQGGYGSFSNADSDEDTQMQGLLNQAFRIAAARGKAAEADPTGIDLYRKRAGVASEFAPKVDRDVLDTKKAAYGEYQQKRRAIQAAQGRTQEEKEMALDALSRDYEEYIASVDSRFRRQP